MDRDDLKRDVQASLAVTLTGIPQGVAYAMIAGLPPVLGLYASALPTIVGSLTRSSSHVIAGPTNALSLLVGGVVAAGVVGLDSVELVTTLALMVGVLQVAAGALRLGAVVDYISRAVVLGYITGAGLLIGVGQLGNLTGTSMGDGGPVTRMAQWVGTLADTSPLAVGVGLLTVALLVGLRRVSPDLPGPVIAMALGIAASWAFDLQARGLATVGEVAPVPMGLPPVSMPSTDPATIRALMPAAVAAAVLSLVESSSVGRSIAARTGERIQMSREFTGQGLANVAAGLFTGYPTSGSLSRSALNHQAGATSRLSGAISGGLVIVVLLVAAPVVDFTPIASLAGLLLVVAWDLVDRDAIRAVLRGLWGDRLAFLGTLVGTWTLALDQAIYVGVGISVVLFLRRARMLNVRELTISRGKIREARRGADNGLSPRLRALHVEGSLFFGAANELSDALDEVLRDPEVRAVVVRVKRARGLDYTTAQVLKAVHVRVKAEGRHLFLVGMTPKMMDSFDRMGLTELYGEHALFPTEREWFVAMDRALLSARDAVGDIGASDEVRAYLDARAERLG